MKEKINLSIIDKTNGSDIYYLSLKFHTLLFILFAFCLAFTTGSSFHSPILCSLIRTQVTLIRNLESYGIEPQEFAHKIQIKAACSTTGNIGHIVLRLNLSSVLGYLARQRGTVDFITFIE